MKRVRGKRRLCASLCLFSLNLWENQEALRREAGVTPNSETGQERHATVTRPSLTVRYVTRRSSACRAPSRCTREVYCSMYGRRSGVPRGVGRGIYTGVHPPTIPGHIHQGIHLPYTPGYISPIYTRVYLPPWVSHPRVYLPPWVSHSRVYLT